MNFKCRYCGCEEVYVASMSECMACGAFTKNSMANGSNPTYSVASSPNSGWQRRVPSWEISYQPMPDMVTTATTAEVRNTIDELIERTERLHRERLTQATIRPPLRDDEIPPEFRAQYEENRRRHEAAQQRMQAEGGADSDS